jgi:ribosomal protein S18 acetylase RimI-like enzyme
MDRISIRRATPEDAPVIHRLLAELEQSLGVQEMVKRKEADILRFGFSEAPFFEALIAWQGERPVGLALYFREFSTWRGSPGVYVQDLYVSNEVRGSGLGRKLMDSLIGRSRSWGATYCKLAVYNDNEAALAFYRHLGFHVSENESTLLIDGL